jgi:ribonuclease Z
MIRVTFLGTSSARPTSNRNVSSLVVRCEGDLLMFDCGEGTQRQMMRYGTGFDIADVFFSHLHADHFLGIIGLLQTMGLQGRRDPIRLWTPLGTEGTLREAVELGGARHPFPVEITGVDAGSGIERRGYAVRAFRSSHRCRSLGYALVEPERPGRFDPVLARALGVPEGPLWGKLHRGERVEVDGVPIDPARIVGPPRPGRMVVYTGDTRPSRSVREAAAGADLLIHEATFAEDETELARVAGHSTSRQAARIAVEAGVRQLILTHFSPRYAACAGILQDQAERVFSPVRAAYDGLMVEVPYAPE